MEKAEWERAPGGARDGFSQTISMGGRTTVRKPIATAFCKSPTNVERMENVGFKRHETARIELAHQGERFRFKGLHGSECAWLKRQWPVRPNLIYPREIRFRGGTSDFFFTQTHALAKSKSTRRNWYVSTT
jgi:hypothetical protein